jgi:hypothetical protein
MMDKFYQVFVSSTFDDLKDERQQVTNTLAKAGYVAAGMELFPAADQQQLEYIKRVIDRSDYYVVIVGGRYGSLADNGFSYTENEFDYAHSKGIPVLAFLHAAPDSIAVGKTEDDSDKKEKLSAFKQKLKSGRMIDFWNDPTDLCMKVVIAVGNAINLTPGVGWVRGDQAIDPKVLQEAEKARIENDELRKRIAELSTGGVQFNPSFLGPSSELALDVSVRTYTERGVPIEHPPFKGKISVKEVLLAFYDDLLVDHPESYIAQLVAARLAQLNGNLNPMAHFSLTDRSRAMLRNQFEALGLVETFSDERSNLRWRLAEKAKKYALSLLALKPVNDQQS